MTITLVQKEIECIGLFNDRVFAHIKKIEESGGKVENINRTNDEGDPAMAEINFIKGEQ